MKRLAAGWILAGCILGAGAASAAGRSIALIIDTSGSMRGSDQPRYTMQIAQVLGDLLADDDELTVIRIGGSAGCSDGPSSALALRLDPRDRVGFKSSLDSLISYGGDNAFAAPIRTAIAALGTDPGRERMLLMVADSGGLGSCDTVLTGELVAFHGSGAKIAAVNLGSSTGAFDSNPAFDLTIAALDAQKLVEAVAAIYQRFLGAKKVQTGTVQGTIEVDIPTFAREAYLVVAADGPVAEIESGAGNPAAAAQDMDYRGGGETRGLDRRDRGFRIARLEAPQPGRWRFDVPGLSDHAGWLLLIDSSVALRLVSQPVLTHRTPSPVEVEVYDQATGRRIEDPSLIPGLEVDLEVEGGHVRLRDDGQGGDRVAGDGILTGLLVPQKTGTLEVPVRLNSDLLDRTTRFRFEVTDAAWGLTVLTPARAVVGEKVTLQLELRALGDRGLLTTPDKIDVLTGGPIFELRDDGKTPDAAAGDLRYAASWTPEVTGVFELDYLPHSSTPIPGVTASVEVVGQLVFGPPVGLEFGSGGSGRLLESRAQLTGSRVKGDNRVEVSSDFLSSGAELEIDLGRGFERLGDQAVPLLLTENGPRDWPVRIKIGDCPDALTADRRFHLLFEAHDAEGQPLRLALPISVVVVPDPWLVCWWPFLAAAVGAVLLGIVIYGFVSPSRFPPHLGVVISPEENLEEGFFHHIRSQRGSGSGFFRDARIYLVPFQLTGRAQGAVARLRAENGRVLIRPVAGTPLWRRSIDDSWEPVPAEETPARAGALYRNELKSFFFAVRGS